MGQYFKAVNLDKKEFVTPNDYGSGLKLMEHSWILNPMVNAIVMAISPAGNWYKDHLVWAGDYMDKGLYMKGLKGKSKKDKTLYDCCRHRDERTSPCIIPVRPALKDGLVSTFIVNHDTKEYVELNNLPEEDPKDPGWNIHPLPLLICSGNGRGGGDFNGENIYTGSWAGHSISAEYLAPEGYRQLVPNFTER
ncbi:hypothetical protein [Sphingobacterium sp.]|uniref:hypothetical protein n=1 Tax=Sphingobacterium sp. TaxID=341027 RepID=UPI0031CE675C